MLHNFNEIQLPVNQYDTGSSRHVQSQRAYSDTLNDHIENDLLYTSPLFVFAWFRVAEIVNVVLTQKGTHLSTISVHE